MKLPEVSITTEMVPFSGGYDSVTPPLELGPSYCRGAQNFEQDINGGYARIAGYERYDGHASPSDATYAVLTCTITGTVALGDVLTNNAGTSFGTVIALPAGQAVLTKVTGTFSTGNIKVGATVVGTCTGAQVTDGASTALLAAQYKNLATDVYRNDISAVPGSGSILGVWVYNDVRYAFRNNLGGTAAAMYKATASGWSLVPLGEEISFTNANANVGEGDVITQGGVTATITRVVVQSGSLASGVNTGKLIFASHAGGNFAAGAATTTGGGALTLSGAQTAITFAIPGGRFQFINENFGGSVTTKRMYGCDGKNRGFEFDGTVFVPISTGMAVDAPNFICAHKKQLFFAFLGSVQHSAPGTPYIWSAILGAGEIALGDTVTGFKIQAGTTSTGSLAIFTTNKISILYGTGVADWNLTTYKEEAGALPYSAQMIGATVMFDHRGITNLLTSQRYGNFVDATLSRRIQTWLLDKRTKVNDSCIVRNRNQYRLFFSDRYALYSTFDNEKLLGMMPVLFAHVVKCVCSVELSDATEVMYFGSDDGYVYQMEKGTSFDGAAIEAFLNLAWNHFKSPRDRKRFRHMTFEVQGSGYAEFEFSYELGYGTTDIGQPSALTEVTSFAPVYWDAFTWDQFYWDGRSLFPTECDMDGTAENMSIMIRSNSDYFAPIKFSGAIATYSMRRKLR